MVSRGSLAVALSRLEPFSEADPALEQYPTDSEVAADLLWEAKMRGDLDGSVLDLGAGTGILAIGAALLGAQVVAVEKDERAIAVFEKNIDLYEGVREHVKVVASSISGVLDPADVVIMNPPFGTRDTHADRAFLERAFQLAPVVYSMHKTSTEAFIEKLAQSASYAVSWTARRDVPLKRSMDHHSRNLKRIDVTFFRLEKHIK